MAFKAVFSFDIVLYNIPFKGFTSALISTDAMLITIIGDRSRCNIAHVSSMQHKSMTAISSHAKNV